MPAEYTPAPCALTTILRTLVVLTVGQTGPLQRAGSRYEESDSNPPRARPRAVVYPVRVLAAASVVACFLSGCTDRPADQVVTPPPDVLLVTIDTLRADRVGVYGGL